MVQNKELDGASPFVQSALSRLSSYLESDDPSSPIAVQITSPPKPGLESEIATVLRLDLGQ
jgi:hypothetical protein